VPVPGDIAGRSTSK